MIPEYPSIAFCENETSASLIKNENNKDINNAAIAIIATIHPTDIVAPTAATVAPTINSAMTVEAYPMIYPSNTS